MKRGGGGGVTGARAKGDFYPWRLIIGNSFCLQVDAPTLTGLRGGGWGAYEQQFMG